MKCYLGISNFLEKISTLSHSLVFLYFFALIAEKGSIKDRNGRDLAEEDIKKRWQEHTELYKKDLHEPVNHGGVITHLELNFLECEVK